MAEYPDIPDGFGVPLVDLTTDLFPAPTMAALDDRYEGGGGGGAVDSVNGEVGVVVLDKGDIGLGNVDNTSDANKPVSTATQTALNEKADVAGVTAALALKAPLASPAFTGTPTGITRSHVGLGNVDNTSDANKPVSTAQAAADALKLDVAAAPELIRDTMATALVAGANVTITPDDGADTITIAASGGGGGSVIGATPVIKIKSGNWFGPYEAPGTSSYAGTLNRLDLVSMYISQSISVNRIACMVSTGGAAGAVVRLGIFNAKPDGMPGTLLLDAGTVVATSTGVKEITISEALSPGLYYLGAVPQVAVSTLRAYSTPANSAARFGWDWDQGYFEGSVGNAINFLSVSSVSGALADLSSASFTYSAGDSIKVGLRAA